MVSLARLGRTAGLALGAATGLAGAGLLAALRRPLPRLDGRLALPDLGGPVEVLRDRWGVPHIYAGSHADLFMAQGYVHAQERLWQMELQRRTGHGQLAEIFGPLALDSDRFLRTLGFGRVARREAELLSGEAREAIEAYVRGVNACIARGRRRLPVEFALLRCRPRPWAPADVLVWSKIMALNLSENWSSELLRARIVAAVGAARAAALDPAYPDDHPLTIPPGARYTPDLGGDALAAAEAAQRFVGRGDGAQGSNAWAAAGARTTSGRPLLANDPHLGLQLPSLWFENHLVGGDYEVSGASIPGTPGVVIGHNARIAWGVTNGMTDVQDLYLERFDPADPTGATYEFRGALERAEIAREEIVVRGPALRAGGGTRVETVEVRVTRHGPIVTPLVPPPGGDSVGLASRSAAGEEQPLALRWTALEPGRLTEAVLALNRARDWDSFRAALADWTVPPQNFVYADLDGHIGYALGGDIPVRARGDGKLPVPGWTGEYEWTGLIPPAELPHALDPPDGLVVTANNRIVGDDYPHPLPAEWFPGYRAARIRELLERAPAGGHDAASFGRIQRDIHSPPGRAFAALAAAGRLPAPDAVAHAARGALAAWDGELTADSIGGLLYATLREETLARAYAEVAGPLGLVAGLGALATLPGGGYRARALPGVLRRIAARDDGWLPAGRTWDGLLAEAWAATVARLRAARGDDVAAWRYGRAHTLTLRHPLGAAPALARLFNRGPFPRGGDGDTVNMGSAGVAPSGAPIYVAPSYRLICDLADWDRSVAMHPSGQSGHPASRHYDDFVQPWLEGRYHPLPWRRATVEAAAAHQLTLAPDAGRGVKGER
jgi:penicillin amidase